MYIENTTKSPPPAARRRLEPPGEGGNYSRLERRASVAVFVFSFPGFRRFFLSRAVFSIFFRGYNFARARRTTPSGRPPPPPPPRRPRTRRDTYVLSSNLTGSRRNAQLLETSARLPTAEAPTARRP